VVRRVFREGELRLEEFSLPLSGAEDAPCLKC